MKLHVKTRSSTELIVEGCPDDVFAHLEREAHKYKGLNTASIAKDIRTQLDAQVLAPWYWTIDGINVTFDIKEGQPRVTLHRTCLTKENQTHEVTDEACAMAVCQSLSPTDSILMLPGNKNVRVFPSGFLVNLALLSLPHEAVARIIAESHPAIAFFESQFVSAVLF